MRGFRGAFLATLRHIPSSPEQDCQYRQQVDRGERRWQHAGGCLDEFPLILKSPEEDSIRLWR